MNSLSNQDKLLRYASLVDSSNSRVKPIDVPLIELTEVEASPSQYVDTVLLQLGIYNCFKGILHEF